MKLTRREREQLCGSVDGPDTSTPSHEDDAISVLRASCDREGHTRVAQWLIESGLHGDKALETVRVYVSACLSPKKREKFGLAEVIVIMARSGDHRLLMHLAERLGYQLKTRSAESRLQQVRASRERLQQQLDELAAEEAGLERGEWVPRFVAPHVMFSRRRTH